MGCLGNFFVEKTMLDWRGGEQKEISLRAGPREGCVLFVRLLQPIALREQYSDRLSGGDSDEKRCARAARACSLAQLRPKDRAGSRRYGRRAMQETA